MAYVICEPCIGVKDKSCIEVCPANCIVEGDDQCYIDPELCINCSLCVGVCPVSAIFDEEEVPEQWKDYTQKNAEFFKF